MSEARRSPLFSAIVLAGVSLTGAAAGCGSESTSGPAASQTPSAKDKATDGGATDEDGAAPDGATEEAVAEELDASCPPDAERETPPCWLIR